jgi:hypothetical protein
VREGGSEWVRGAGDVQTDRTGPNDIMLEKGCCLLLSNPIETPCNKPSPVVLGVHPGESMVEQTRIVLCVLCSRDIKNFDKIWTEQPPENSPCGTPTAGGADAFKGFT